MENIIGTIFTCLVAKFTMLTISCYVCTEFANKYNDYFNEDKRPSLTRWMLCKVKENENLQHEHQGKVIPCYINFLCSNFPHSFSFRFGLGSIVPPSQQCDSENSISLSCKSYVYCNVFCLQILALSFFFLFSFSFLF